MSDNILDFSGKPKVHFLAPVKTVYLGYHVDIDSI